MKDLETMLTWLEKAAEEYGGRTIENIIVNVKSRIKYHKKHGEGMAKQ